jgi:hypothetical protein
VDVDMTELAIKVAVLSEKLDNNEKSMDALTVTVDKLNNNLQNNFTTKAEFNPVKKQVDAIIAIVITAVVAGALAAGAKILGGLLG